MLPNPPHPLAARRLHILQYVYGRRMGEGAGIDGAHYNSMPQEKSSLLKDAPPFAYYGRLGVIPFPKRLAERIAS